ncbi:MAG TPA: ATP synthase F0 subunit B [Blastocatellia bacterium]|nr:ATP synthase F0 subunit B [Blastocatellia bacterium]
MLANIALAFAEGSDNIISPDLSLVVVFVLFIIFVFLMNELLFKPVGHVLDERHTKTEGAVNEARAASRRYQAKLADYEATIRSARVESYRRLEQDRATALERRRQLIEEAKQRSNLEIERAKAEIGQQTSQARAALERESRQIAEQISRTLLGRTVGGGAD